MGIAVAENQGKWRLLAPKTCIFLKYLGAIRDRIGLKRTYFAPERRLRRKFVTFPDLQKLETLIWVVLGLN